MNQIPLRDFQLKASLYLKELPLELTRYGRVVCLVVHPSVNTVRKSPFVNTKPVDTKVNKPSVNILKDKSVNTIPPKIPQVKEVVNTLPNKPTVNTSSKISLKIIKTVADIPGIIPLTKSKWTWICPHGRPGRYCKVESCRAEAIKKEGNNV